MIKVKNKNITTRKFFKYCVVGGSGAILSWASVYALTEWLHLWYMLSLIITTFVVVVYNYLLNSFWTFKD